MEDPVSKKLNRRKGRTSINQLIESQYRLNDFIKDPKTEGSALPALIRSWLDIQAELRLLTGRSFGPISGPLPKRLRHLQDQLAQVPGVKPPKTKPGFQEPTEGTEDNPEEEGTG